MGRNMPEDRRLAIKRLIREGATSRAISTATGCSTASVARIKEEMGIIVQREKYAYKSRPAGVQREVIANPTEPPPSAAALRLAEFDPVLARALRLRMAPLTEGEEEEDDG